MVFVTQITDTDGCIGARGSSVFVLLFETSFACLPVALEEEALVVNNVEILMGYPQGTCLGRLLFTLFVALEQGMAKFCRQAV